MTKLKGRLIEFDEQKNMQIKLLHGMLYSIFFKTPVLLHDKIGFPVINIKNNSDDDDFLENKSSETKNKIKILHSPSHKTAK